MKLSSIGIRRVVLGLLGVLLLAALAFVVMRSGWRAGFWISACLGVVVAIAVFVLVPRQQAAHADRSSPLAQMTEVIRLGLSRPLRGLIAVALVSLAASLVLRGLWRGWGARSCWRARGGARRRRGRTG